MISLKGKRDKHITKQRKFADLSSPQRWSVERYWRKKLYKAKRVLEFRKEWGVLPSDILVVFPYSYKEYQIGGHASQGLSRKRLRRFIVGLCKRHGTCLYSASGRYKIYSLRPWFAGKKFAIKRPIARLLTSLTREMDFNKACILIAIPK